MILLHPALKYGSLKEANYPPPQAHCDPRRLREGHRLPKERPRGKITRRAYR